MLNSNLFSVAATAVIQNPEGKVLLLYRAKDSGHEPLTWDIPGGRLNSGEDLKSGLRREVFEETGIDQLEINSIIRDFRFISSDTNQEVIGLTFACSTNNSQVVLSEEHSDYLWLDIDEAIEKTSHPGVKKDLIAFKVLT